MISLPWRRSTNASAINGIALLKANHREIERWIEAFQLTTSTRRQLEIAFRICEMVRAHIEIGQQIFYPAFLKATDADHRKCRAAAELRAMGKLIEEIERTSPSEDSYFQTTHLLCEMFLHHVKQEEEVNGIFELARNARMDLEALGEHMRRRHPQPPVAACLGRSRTMR